MSSFIFMPYNISSNIIIINVHTKWNVCGSKNLFVDFCFSSTPQLIISCFCIVCCHLCYVSMPQMILQRCISCLIFINLCMSFEMIHDSEVRVVNLCRLFLWTSLPFLRNSCTLALLQPGFGNRGFRFSLQYLCWNGRDLDCMYSNGQHMTWL